MTSETWALHQGPFLWKGYNKLDIERVTECNKGCTSKSNVRSVELATFMYKYSKSSEGPRDITLMLTNAHLHLNYLISYAVLHSNLYAKYVLCLMLNPWIFSLLRPVQVLLTSIYVRVLTLSAHGYSTCLVCLSVCYHCYWQSEEPMAKAFLNFYNTYFRKTFRLKVIAWES